MFETTGDRVSAVDAGASSVAAWDQSLFVDGSWQGPNLANLKALTGSSGNDILMGTNASELIVGFGSQDTARGKGTRDVMYGSGGNDTFVLGDNQGVFYDDRNGRSSGRSDYVSVRDFASGDSIILAGTASDYVMRTEKLGRSGTSIYHDSNKNGAFDKSDELVAHVAGSKRIASLTDSALIYLGGPVTPSNDMTIKAATAAELTSALERVSGGETIVLTGADYGSFSMRRINPNSEVTITSDPQGGKASFRNLVISESSNLKFQDFEVQLTPVEGQQNLEALIRISKSDDVTFDRLLLQGFDATTGVSQDDTVLDASRNVIGLPVGRGITIEQTSGITVSNSELVNLSRGIALSKSKDLQITGNEIHDLRTTGIQGGGVTDLLISGNHIYKSTPWRFGSDGDHGDYIHIWSTGSKRSDNGDVTITGNLLEQRDGADLLGIYVDDNATKIGFENYSITNNILLIGNHQGIRAENVRGVISDNTLIQSGGNEKDVPFIINTNSGSLSVENNISGGIITYAGASSRQAGNKTAQKWEDGPSHYSSILHFNESNGVTIADAMQRESAGNAGADLGLFDDLLASAGVQLSQVPDIAEALVPAPPYEGEALSIPDNVRWVPESASSAYAATLDYFNLA